MPRYLLTVTEKGAQQLERWVAGALQVMPGAGGYSTGVPVAGLDAVTEDETAAIRARLATGGPLYHASGRTSDRSEQPGGPCMTDTELTDYTFDIVAVATFHIGAPDYATARRAAEGIQEFNVRDNTVSEGNDDPPGLIYSLTCVAPRGKASFVDADPEDGSVPAEDVQTFTEPITDVYLSRDLIAAMHASLTRLDEAANSTSDDDEHAAARCCADHLALLLRMTGHPYDPEDEPDPVDVADHMAGDFTPGSDN